MVLPLFSPMLCVVALRNRVGLDELAAATAAVVITTDGFAEEYLWQRSFCGTFRVHNCRVAS